MLLIFFFPFYVAFVFKFSLISYIQSLLYFNHHLILYLYHHYQLLTFFYFFIFLFHILTQGLRPRVPRDCPWASIMTECWQQDASQR